MACPSIKRFANDAARALNRFVAYDNATKRAFHQTAERFLEAVAAKVLHLDRHEYDLRSNPAGPAILGDVTLHADFVYIQISDHCGLPAVLYRTCNGRKDYTGGPNNWCHIDQLADRVSGCLYARAVN